MSDIKKVSLDDEKEETREEKRKRILKRNYFGDYKSVMLTHSDGTRQ